MTDFDGPAGQIAEVAIESGVRLITFLSPPFSDQSGLADAVAGLVPDATVVSWRAIPDQLRRIGIRTGARRSLLVYAQASALLRRGDTVVVDADNHRSRDRRRATQAMADMGIRTLVAVVRVEPEVTIARFRDDPRGMTEAMVLAIAQRLARVTSDELRGDGFDQVLEVTL